MKKILFLLLLFSVLLFAREKLQPVKNCPAFNNMKHSKNSHNVLLDKEEKYHVLDHHKGQYLILIKGEQPSQRWVDESCFLEAKLPQNSLDTYVDRIDKSSETSINTKKYEKSQSNLLALSWHNAFCETHQRRKECRRNVFSLYRSKHRETHFILHGLWPQPANKAYCGVEGRYITMDKYKKWNKLPEPKLSKETRERLTEIMPGVHSNLHKHEWYRHGTCYGTDAESYFKEAIALVDQFHQSKVSDFFENHIGKRVTLKQVRREFNKDFGAGTGKSVELRCKNGLLTELWLHLEGESEKLSKLLQKGRKVHSACSRGMIDKAGFGR